MAAAGDASSLADDVVEELVRSEGGVAYRYNQADPTETEELRSAFQSEMDTHWDDLIDRVESWFADTETINYSRFRFRFMDWFEQAAFNEVVESVTSGQLHRGRHWTGTYVRLAYQHGLEIAKDDLVTAGVGRFSARDATQFHDQDHQNSLEMEYESAYFGLRDQVHRIVDSAGEVVREGIDSRYDLETFEENLVHLVDTEARNAGIAHANTTVVDTVNESLLTAYKLGGVEEVGVAPEDDSPGSVQFQNYVRFGRIRTNQPDEDGGPETFAEVIRMEEGGGGPPGGPDEIQFVTAGDDRVCDDCKALEGTVVSLSDATVEPSSLLPVHPNCRCRWMPVPPA